MTPSNLNSALALIDMHFDAFHSVAPFASGTGHPVPMDTRGWSQILVSTLTGINGLDRKKGADLNDGSDVKGANTWLAIDTPRFNGVIKAGTKADFSDRIESLDGMPHLYFVLWDETTRGTYRCRVWVVRADSDPVFRSMCGAWYTKRTNGEIISANFQLHPPRGQDGNVFRNTCGNLSYPLLFSAERTAQGNYQLISFNPDAVTQGSCVQA